MTTLQAVIQEPMLFSSCGSAIFSICLQDSERREKIMEDTAWYIPEELAITFTQISLVIIQSCAPINCAREAGKYRLIVSWRNGI